MTQQIIDRPEWVSLKSNAAGKQKWSKFGLLSGLSVKDRKETSHTVVCLACRITFAKWDEAREHECKAEERFRMVTGRAVPKLKRRYTRRQPEQTAEVTDTPTAGEFITSLSHLLDERDKLQEQVHILTGENVRLSNQVTALTETIKELQKQSGGIAEIMRRIAGR